MTKKQLYFLLTLLVPSVKGQISFSLGNVTYWSPGSLVKLPWTYNFPKAQIFVVEISFTKSGSSTGVTLALGFNGDNLTSRNSSQFTIEEQATLVFKNANLGHNGTYALRVTLRGGAGQQTSEVKVIILEQPIAKQTCSEQNGNFYCECKSDVGNPPPLAYWSKNGKKIGDFGYKEKNLTIDDITKREAAMYSCNVKSHYLSDQKNICLEAPKITSFVSKPEYLVLLNTAVTFTCNADGILPTMFNISFNGKDPERIQNGVKTIDKFTKDNVGGYKCIAFNIIGPHSSQELKLNFTEMFQKATTCPTTSDHGNGASVGTKEKSNCDTTGFGWYIILIALVCGIILGMIFLYGIMSLRQRFKSKKDESKPGHDYDTPETHREDAGDDSAYQELELRNREPESSYQALRMNTRKRMDNETKIEDEAGNYQELDKVREDENNYQSLNRA